MSFTEDKEKKVSVKIQLSCEQPRNQQHQKGNSVSISYRYAAQIPKIKPTNKSCAQYKYLEKYPSLLLAHGNCSNPPWLPSAVMQLNKGQIHHEKMLMQLGDTNSTFFSM